MLIQDQLKNFTGAEKHYKHRIAPMRFTEGVYAFRELTDGFWLIDAIASYQTKGYDLDNKTDGFQLWTLEQAPTKDKPNQVHLICKADTNTKPVVRQVIEYSDFPFDQFPDGVRFYLLNEILILPSEY